MREWVTAQGGSLLRLSAIQLKASLELDARVYCVTGPAGSGKTEIAVMHAALAYDRGCFVVLAARTKKFVRELSLRFRQRRPESQGLDFELISHAGGYPEDSMSLYLRRLMNSVVNIDWWVFQSRRGCPCLNWARSNVHNRLQTVDTI
jgi:hypothetical protein